MSIFQTKAPAEVPDEDPKIGILTTEIEAEKNAIRDACMRMGKAYFDAHKDDPEDTLEPDVRCVLDATDAIKAKQAEIRELKGLVLCPECRREISKDVTFCNFCGYRMKAPEPEPEPEPAPAEEMPTECDSCGAPLRPGQKFCVGCGKRVADMAKPMPKPRICSNCGTELPEGAKFCFECGTPAG